MLTVTIGNQKGGAGKTTCTANLAAIAGAAGLRVLTVDADPQGQLTESFAAEASEGASLGELLDHSLSRRPALEQVLLPHVAPGVDLLPAEERPLERAEREMDSDPLAGLTRLRDVLDSVSDRYDLVLIDTPPRLTSLAVGPLVASDGVVVPMAPESFHFLSTRAFLAKVEQVAASPLNPSLRLLGILFNAVDPAAEETRVIEQMVRDEGWPVLTARVPVSKLASKVILRGEPPAAVSYPHLPFARAFREATNEILHLLSELPDLQPAGA